MYKVKKHDTECFAVVDGAGREVAEAETFYQARKAADYTTGPLDINQVNHILNFMGWELVDVAAFMNTARRFKY